MSPDKDEPEQFDDREAQERFEKALRGAFKTPPQSVPAPKKRPPKSKR